MDHLSTHTHHDHSHTASENSSIWEQYIALMSDVPHLMVEMTFVLLHILAFEIIRRSFKKWANRRFDEEHALLDQEHGVEHDESYSVER